MAAVGTMAYSHSPLSPPPNEEQLPDGRSHSGTPTRTPQTSASTDASSAEHSTSPSNTSTSQRLHAAAKPRERKRSTTKLEHFELIRVVGKGCAGRVLLVRHAPTNTCHAMKAISKRSVFLGGEVEHTLAELSILKRFAVYEPDNPFVCKLNYAFTDQENFYFIMDFYPGGDLATQMEIHGALGATRTRFYACDIVQALEDIHRHGIICRDLKPENILLNQKGHAVIADFGLSKEFAYRGESHPIEPIMYPGTEPYPEWAGAGLGSLRDVGRGKHRVVVDRAHSFVGTAEYLAPEVIMGTEYSYAVDYWSLGCIILESLIGQCPFRREEDEEPLVLYNKIAHDPWTDILLRRQFRKNNLKTDYGLDEYTRNIIDALLQKDPMRRLTEPFIKRHDYFFGVDWETVRSGEYVDPYPLDIHPMADYNTRYFPRLHANETPTVDMSTHGDGEDVSRDAEARFKLESKRFQKELEEFKWDIDEYNDMDEVEEDTQEENDHSGGEGMDDKELVEAENALDLPARATEEIPREQDEADGVDQVMSEDRAAAASLDTIPESPADLKLARRLSAHPETTMRNKAKRNSAVSKDCVRLRDSKHSDSGVSEAGIRGSPDNAPVPLTSAALEGITLATSPPTLPLDETALPPGAMPSIPPGSPVRSTKNLVGLDLKEAPDRTRRAVPVSIMARPAFKHDLSKEVVLPSHLPSSGLSVSDVVSIPSPGLGSPRLVRRHAPMPSVDTIPIGRLSVDLHGTITQIEEDDWEELVGESIPSIPNGGPSSGSNFFRRLRHKPSQIVTSGLRRQVKSSDSSRETSPTKGPKPRILSGNTRKALEKVFPRMRKSGATAPGPTASPAKLRKSATPPPVASPPRTPNRPGQIRRHTESAGWFERPKRGSSPRGTKTSASSGASAPDNNALSTSASAASGAPTVLETPAARLSGQMTQVEVKADETGSPRLELKTASPIVWELDKAGWVGDAKH